MKTPTTNPDEWTGDEALRVVTFLQDIIDEIWRVYGHRMEPCLREQQRKFSEISDDELDLPF